MGLVRVFVQQFILFILIIMYIIYFNEIIWHSDNNQILFSTFPMLSMFDIICIMVLKYCICIRFSAISRNMYYNKIYYSVYIKKCIISHLSSKWFFRNMLFDYIEFLILNYENIIFFPDVISGINGSLCQSPNPFSTMFYKVSHSATPTFLIDLLWFQILMIVRTR